MKKIGLLFLNAFREGIFFPAFLILVILFLACEASSLLTGNKYHIKLESPIYREGFKIYEVEIYREENGCIIFTDERGNSISHCGKYDITEQNGSNKKK